MVWFGLAGSATTAMVASRGRLFVWKLFRLQFHSFRRKINKSSVKIHQKDSKWNIIILINFDFDIIRRFHFAVG